MIELEMTLEDMNRIDDEITDFDGYFTRSELIEFENWLEKVCGEPQDFA